ncbi:type II toxin-antitoxin system VapC family toxin [Frankia sp. Cas4]|uniref:type II toxin-antitoxin system VapC family toxin n=1 Tax=Frankia sp. Cas4 TaxID=3073927 RepID=UPI002AD50056|nr:type II toxin-antitoxin system VapC family toxin [Frankia sp. Cas4]
MIVPDVNLLLYAVISGFPQHPRAHAWWEQTINSTARVGLTQPAVFGFLRIATHARVLQSPLAVNDAVEYVHGWLEQPNVDLLVPGPEHLRIALELLKEIGTAGNLTTDVQLAAYAIEHQGEMHSNDTDFARFPNLKWINPLQ